MTFALVVLAGINVFLVLGWLAQFRVFAAEREQWAKERQLMITRIQHPEFIVSEPEKPAIPDVELLTSEPDDIDLVGTVQMNGADGD